MARLRIGHRTLACGSSPPEASSGNRFTSSDGVHIAYTIDLPDGAGPFPAVVLVHGSGRVRREDLAGLSAQFTSHGWAVLRYDKRGVGDSDGTYTGVGVANSTTVIPLLASDAAAAMRTLRTDSRIDPARVGFAGGSQAGWIIPVAVSLESHAKFAIILSGPTVSVGTEIYYSSLAETSTLPLDDAYEQLNSFTGPHGFDPSPYLASLTAPTLWLFGAEDRSIPTRVCVEQLNALPTPNSSTVLVYAGLGHSLSDAVWTAIYDFLGSR